jgi:hypothetical protein
MAAINPTVVQIERDRIATALQNYRSSITDNNRQILNDTIDYLAIEQSTGDTDDLSRLYAELYQSAKHTSELPQHQYTKLSDLFANIPDGTYPPYPSQNSQNERLEELESEIFTTGTDQGVGPLSLPTQYKILMSMTGGILGPDYPKPEFENIVSAIDGALTDCTESETILKESGLLNQGNWRILTGWQCGVNRFHTQGDRGGTWIVYCSCEHIDDGSRDWGWRYIFKHPDKEPIVCDDVVEFLDMYTLFYTDGKVRR